RSIDVRDERVEEDDAGRHRGIGRRTGDGIEGDAAREVVEPEVQTGARLERQANFRIRLARCERATELDENDLRDREPGRASERARQELGDERLGALAGAAEFDDVEAEVVSLDEGGYGAALAKREDIPDGVYGAQHAGEGGSAAKLLMRR